MQFQSAQGLLLKLFYSDWSYIVPVLVATSSSIQFYHQNALLTNHNQPQPASTTEPIPTNFNFNLNLSLNLPTHLNQPTSTAPQPTTHNRIHLGSRHCDTLARFPRISAERSSDVTNARPARLVVAWHGGLRSQVMSHHGDGARRGGRLICWSPKSTRAPLVVRPSNPWKPMDSYVVLWMIPVVMMLV